MLLFIAHRGDLSGIALAGGDNAKTFTTEYGSISAASVGALTEWLTRHPDSNAQQLRQLIRILRDTGEA